MPKPPTNGIRPSIRALPAYHISSYDCPVKLNQNESPYDLPSEIKDRILDRVRDTHWSRYPESMPTDLVKALSRHTGVDAASIIVANGSNTLLQNIFAATVEPGAGVVIPSPSFSLYGHYTSVFDGEPIYVDLDAAYRFDHDALLGRVEQRDPRVVIVGAPNNPTGCDTTNDHLETFLSATNGFVIVDEAYGEFTDRTALDLLGRHANLIILKTLSKAFGGAGLRIGYLLAHPDVVSEMIKVKVPFDINLFSRIAALELLQHDDLIRDRAGKIRSERDRMYDAMQKIDGLTPYPSSANLILFEVDDPNAIFSRMVDRGVLIRNVSSYPRLDRGLRVSVGTPTENDRFLEAIEASVAAT